MEVNMLKRSRAISVVAAAMKYQFWAIVVTIACGWSEEKYGICESTLQLKTL